MYKRQGRFDDWIGVIALPARSALRDAFDERAGEYARSDWHRSYAAQLVAASPLQPGSRVLDVAAGTGFVSRAAAARIGPDGFVTAVDISEGMLSAPVSYTHLDVYKRQAAASAGRQGSPQSLATQRGAVTFSVVPCAAVQPELRW